MFHRTSSESASKADTDGIAYRSSTDEQQRIAINKNRSSNNTKSSILNDTVDITTTPIGSNNSTTTDIPHNDRYWPLSSSKLTRGQSSRQQYQQVATPLLAHLNSSPHQLSGTTKEDTTKSHQNSLNHRTRTHLLSSQNSSAPHQQQDISEAQFDNSSILKNSKIRQHKHQHSTPISHLPSSHLHKHSQFHQNLQHNLTMSLAAQLASSAGAISSSDHMTATTPNMPNTSVVDKENPTTSAVASTSSNPPQNFTSTTSPSSSRLNQSDSTPNTTKTSNQKNNQARHKTYTITTRSIEADLSQAEDKQQINYADDTADGMQTTGHTITEQDDQQQLNTDEALAAIKQELAQIGSADNLNDKDLEALGSLERSLPVELSFLIKQQAYCMARINYLTRQVKELKEQRQQQHQQQQQPTHVNYLNQQIQQQSHKQQPIIPTSYHHQHQYVPQQHQIAHNHQLDRTYQYTNRIGQHATVAQAVQPMHVKNGNLILSDDSGGEYSRATISDDDELSSLLDQIAKTVRSERNPTTSNNQSVILNTSAGSCPSGIAMMSSHQTTLQPMTTPAQHGLAALGQATFSHNQVPQQQYAIINPNQFHQQAVPIFVMGSPVAVTHPSSISSNVLPGVHFQPEPRYNQYYEDLYVNSGGPMHHQHHRSNHHLTNMRPLSSHTNHQQHVHQAHHQLPNQFDSSISAIEQLVSQREKRQIKTQLKSADNWLKMRSSTLCNSVENHTSNIQNSGLIHENGSNENHLKDSSTERVQQQASVSTSTITNQMNRDNDEGFGQR